MATTVMPFGKFRGRPLSRCPIGYLEWILKHVSHLEPALEGALREEVHRRAVAMAAAVPPEQPLSEVSAADDVTALLKKLDAVQEAQVALLRWAVEHRQLPGPLSEQMWGLLARDHVLADRLAELASRPPGRGRAFDLFTAAAGVN
jgi:hypothetical protein